MSLASWLSWAFSPSHARRAQRRHPAATAPRRRHTFRPSLETLEDRVTPSLSTLASFGADGIGPRGVIVDSSGNLYGVTSNGGANSDGRVFELAKGSGTITTLASFNGTNGIDPLSLMMDSTGNLYGTTKGGGASGYGTVYEVTAANVLAGYTSPGNGAITTVASFNVSDGYAPDAADGVIMDSSGNLFGTTAQGGANTGYDFPYGAGTVFEVKAGSGTITTLASFTGADGYRPCGTVMVDSSGNLYGTVEYGGASGVANGDGTVFELTKVNSTTYSSTITTLASFNGTDGAWPIGRMVMDGSGILYGATEDGGSLDDGTVFEVAISGTIGTITTLTSFNGTDQDAPEAGVVMDSNGNLYGTTAYGGGDNGSFFEIAKDGNTYSSTVTNLGSLNGSNGGDIEGVAMDSSGNLYAAALEGGANGDGTIVELTNGPSFAISGPTGLTAGTAGIFTITALNANGTPNPNYSGTVAITSSDPRAGLPGNLDISGGSGTFSVTLYTARTQSITATDINNSSMTNLYTTVAVSPAAASQVVFNDEPSSSSTAGQTLATVSAVLEDAYGNGESGDNSGTVTLSVNTGPSTLMGGTLTEPVAAGFATFSNLVLDTYGTYTLAAVAALPGVGTLGPAVSSSFTISPISLSFGNITYNSRTKLYSETVTLTNTTTGTLTGPMSLELTNLPSGVTLTDATGTTNGNPYYRFLTSGKTLKKGASASITLTFTAASLGDLTFDPEVVVGL